MSFPPISFGMRAEFSSYYAHQSFQDLHGFHLAIKELENLKKIHAILEQSTSKDLESHEDNNA